MTENQNPTKNNTIKAAAGILVFLNAAVWIGFGIAAAAGWNPGLPQGSIQWGLGGLAVIIGAVMLFLYALSKKRIWGIYLLMGLLALISLLSLTDEAGLLDWIFYAINLAALVLLVLDQRKQS